jgi:hypothetical protein
LWHNLSALFTCAGVRYNIAGLPAVRLADKDPVKEQPVVRRCIVFGLIRPVVI